MHPALVRAPGARSNADMAEPLSELKSLVARPARPGAPATVLAGVRATVSPVPTQAIHCVNEPSLGLVVQGAKRTVVGDRVFEYGEGDFVVTSVDLPIASRITRASEARPYLACGIALD